MLEKHDNFLDAVLTSMIAVASLVYSNMPTVDTFFHYAGEVFGFVILILQFMILLRKWRRNEKAG